MRAQNQRRKIIRYNGSSSFTLISFFRRVTSISNPRDLQMNHHRYHIAERRVSGTFDPQNISRWRKLLKLNKENILGNSLVSWVNYPIWSPLKRDRRCVQSICPFEGFWGSSYRTVRRFLFGEYGWSGDGGKLSSHLAPRHLAARNQEIIGYLCHFYKPKYTQLT